jgi:chemotaxis protein MotD
LPSAVTVEEQLGVADPNQRAAANEPILAELSRRIGSSDNDKWAPVKKGQAPSTPTDDLWPRPAAVSVMPAPRTEPANGTQRPKANVQRQETHFAPVMTTTVGPEAAGEGGKSGAGVEALPGEPAGTIAAAVPSFEDSTSAAMPLAQQIADRVAAEAASAPEFTERTGMTPLWQQGMKPALKVLHIQLQPADLGTVSVRMELKDAELTLHVEADRKETADLIRNDQDTLATLLRSAGYNVDSASVRIVEGDRTLASQQSGQQSAQANLQSSTQSQSGASDRQGHARGEDTNGGDRPQTGRNDNNETTANRAGRGVYV